MQTLTKPTYGQMLVLYHKAVLKLNNIVTLPYYTVFGQREEHLKDMAKAQEVVNRILIYILRNY